MYHTYNRSSIRVRIILHNDLHLFAEKFGQTFITMLSRLPSMRRKRVNANRRAAAETIVSIAWYSASVHHNCALLVKSARIKRFKNTSGRQDCRNL